MSFIRTISALAGATLLSGCLSGMDGGPLVREGEPVARIVVANRTAATITAVTISDCDNFTHGLNRLGSGETIPPGGARSWVVSAGCWDVQAGYGWSTGYSVADFREVVGPGVTFTFNVLP